MSLLTEASLIVTPNAYNVGKLYSVIPNTTLGDMDVVRATSATRVNEQGLIEIARTNLVLYSEEFDNIYWTKVTTNITANTAIAPDGTMTADTFTPTSAVTTSAIQRTFTGITGSHTISVYARVDSGTKSFRFFRFNVTDGAVSSPTFTATTTWQRFTWNTSPTVTSSWFIANASTDLVPFFVWGAQLEAGETATEYIPTVASIRTKFAGITQDGGVGSNIPRIDYPPLGGCPSILVEPARTNSLLYSEQFDNASWGKTNATVTANTITAPDGTSTADTINLSAGTAPRVTQNYLIANSTTYTLSCFFKNIALTAGQTFDLRYNNQVGSPNNFEMIATIDLAAGTATYSFAGTLVTGYSGTVTGVVEPYPNGWYRISVTLTTGTGATNNGQIQIIHASQARSFYAWGAQLEAGSTATSYIPTVAAPVPRDADVTYNISATTLIGQTEGTLFVDVIGTKDRVGSAKMILQISGTKSIHIAFYGIYLNIVSGLIDFFPVFTSDVNYKIAVCYSNTGNFRLYVNGVKTHEVNTYVGGTFSNLGIGCTSSSTGTNQVNSTIKSAVLWKTALTDDQCILLTGPSFSS